MLTKLKSLREEREEGFTLIELLVVILIIGILAAIAIPVFLNQRQTANDASVKADMKTVASTIETALVSNPNATKIIVTTSGRTATACAISTGTSCPAGSPTVPLSESVTVVTSGASNSNTRYILNAYHSNGKNYVNGSPLVYDSSLGGMQN